MTPLTYEFVSERLAYDPDTGFISWRVKPNATLNIGDEAGTLREKDGYVVITIAGRPYPAQYIAWLLHYREWPANPVRIQPLAHGLKRHPDRARLRHASRSDLRIENLTTAKRRLATNEKAQYQREYARRNRERTRQRRQMAKLRPTVSIEKSVLHNQTKDHWEVHHPRTARHRIVSTHIEHSDALAAAALLRRRLLFLDTYTPAIPDHAHAAYAGDNPATAATLADFIILLVYEPDTGTLYWRDGTKAGIDATEPYPNGNGYLFVQHAARRYSAHNVAWFMSTGRWPARRAIAHRDGDHANNAIANLYDRNAQELAA